MVMCLVLSYKYIIYTSGLALLLSEHAGLGQLTQLVYADDIQVHVHCLASSAASAVSAMGGTLAALEASCH